MRKRKKKNKCSNRNEHKLPPANANGINHSETQTPSPKLRKPYGRAGISASTCLCRRSKHKKKRIWREDVNKSECGHNEGRKQE